MADLTGTPEYTDHVRQLETTDPSHPATWNPNYQTLINNDSLFKALTDITGFFSGGFLPGEGSVTFTYDDSNRIVEAEYLDGDEEIIATITISYDDDHGGRIDYVEAVIVSPDTTIRETFSYDENNLITGSVRTVS